MGRADDLLRFEEKGEKIRCTDNKPYKDNWGFTVFVSKNRTVGTVKFGTLRLTNSCVRAECSRGFLALAGCGVIDVEPPCTLGKEDLTKDYPERD
ncbi:hypothetical protein FQA39_LY04587 [Lamprigera yunnana]|nr:hypothetical protein FQA39_LY04587 [Lamprigera yunnana]